MQTILVDRTHLPLVVVTLNRPPKRNALSLDMWLELPRIFDALTRDDSVRGVVLTGADGHFSAGADISEFAEMRGDAASGARYEAAVDGAVEAILRTAKPTLAAVDGYCLGGGCSLAMACDFRFAHRGATFGIPAARLGVVYGVLDTRNLVNIVGRVHAKRILFSACRFDAEEALRIGFVSHVDSATAAQSGMAWLAEMTRNAPLSIAGAKRVLMALDDGIAAEDAAALAGVMRASLESEDYREGVRAYLEKRDPVFRGR